MSTIQVRTILTTLILHHYSSDVSLEQAFIVGVLVLGVISLGAGFSNDKIAIIICRALSGIGTFLSGPI